MNDSLDDLCLFYYMKSLHVTKLHSKRKKLSSELHWKGYRCCIQRTAVTLSANTAWYVLTQDWPENRCRLLCEITKWYFWAPPTRMCEVWPWAGEGSAVCVGAFTRACKVACVLLWRWIKAVCVLVFGFLGVAPGQTLSGATPCETFIWPTFHNKRRLRL